jgi:uncharacterized UPF0160 family protein
VVRTRDGREIAAADIVVDVGGVYDETRNRFDHHQVGGAGERENGIPYAAFGLVWEKFGETITHDPVTARRVDTVLVAPIDANDNGINLSAPVNPGISSYELSDVIRAFAPTWLESDRESDTAFSEAVAFAKTLLTREIRRAEAYCAGEREVLAVYERSSDKRLLVCDNDLSWKEAVARLPEPLYVIHPQGATWHLYCVRDNPHVFKNRKGLPSSWAGLRDEELAGVTGVADAVFCHRNRFMAVAKSKEGAIELAKLALASS